MALSTVGSWAAMMHRLARAKPYMWLTALCKVWFSSVSMTPLRDWAEGSDWDILARRAARCSET